MFRWMRGLLGLDRKRGREDEEVNSARIGSNFQRSGSRHSAQSTAQNLLLSDRTSGVQGVSDVRRAKRAKLEFDNSESTARAQLAAVAEATIVVNNEDAQHDGDDTIKSRKSDKTKRKKNNNKKYHKNKHGGSSGIGKKHKRAGVVHTPVNSFNDKLKPTSAAIPTAMGLKAVSGTTHARPVLVMGSIPPSLSVVSSNSRRRKGRPSMQAEYMRADRMRVKFEENSRSRRANAEAKLLCKIYDDLFNSVPRQYRDLRTDDYRMLVRQKLAISTAEQQVEQHEVQRQQQEQQRQQDQLQMLQEQRDFCGKFNTHVSQEDAVVAVDDEMEDVRTDEEEVSTPAAPEDEEEIGVFHGANPGETLTPAQLEAVEFVWDENADGSEVVAENARTKVSRGQMMCLRDGQWLNDEVINFKLAMLNDSLAPVRDSQLRVESEETSALEPVPSKSLKIWVWNTHFYVKLMGHTEGSNAKDYTYVNVKRWTKRKKINIFAMDRVVVPIHEGIHWACAVIDFLNRSFDYYDSLCLPNPGCLEGLAQWVKDESKDKLGQDMDLSDWSYNYHSDIPRQDNGYDCGIFAVLFAETVGCGKAMNFTNKHIAYHRRKMVLDLINYEIM